MGPMYVYIIEALSWGSLLIKFGCRLLKVEELKFDMGFTLKVVCIQAKKDSIN